MFSRPAAKLSLLIRNKSSRKYRRFTSTLLSLALTASAIAIDKVQLSIDVSKTGAKIDRNIFGQFAEHLGHGIYDGIWVGPDSAIPNTRGIRSDVVNALRAIKVPNVRWPGGCFADEYHWRNAIGPSRAVTLNPNWGGVAEPNTFGTHEFMDFMDQIGSEAYVSVNVGSGTPDEAANWLEYMTAVPQTAWRKSGVPTVIRLLTKSHTSGLGTRAGIAAAI